MSRSFNSRSVRAKLVTVIYGAAETVPYITVTNLARTLRELKDRDIMLVGTTDDVEKNIYDVDFSGGYVDQALTRT